MYLLGDPYCVIVPTSLEGKLIKIILNLDSSMGKGRGSEGFVKKSDSWSFDRTDKNLKKPLEASHEQCDNQFHDV